MTKMVINTRKIGKRGFPTHWQELGLEPPLIEVPDDDPRPEYIPEPKKE